jgi:branched-chain amino acid transport system ATP-binding protein
LNDEAMHLLDEVGLSTFADTVVAEMPYGRKRALELATTLALDPQMILLDEPTQGMGQEDIARIVNLIRKISHGRTILMVEHNLSVVADLCDRITVLTRGSVLAEGSYDDISRNPEVLEAYVGSSDIADAHH